jgi:hypothetical protein
MTLDGDGTRLVPTLLASKLVTLPDSLHTTHLHYGVYGTRILTRTTPTEKDW